MVENLEGPTGRVYPVVQVIIQPKQSLLLLGAQIRGLQLGTRVLRCALVLVQEVAQVGDPALGDVVAVLSQGVADRF